MSTGAILDLPINPYGMWLHLFNDRQKFCRTVNGLLAKREQMSLASLLECSGFCVSNVAAARGLIWMGVFSEDRADLVHELTHAVDHVVDHVQIPRGEPVAYLMGHLYRECAAALARSKAGGRKK